MTKDTITSTDIKRDLLDTPIKNLTDENILFTGFFSSFGIQYHNEDRTVSEFVEETSNDFFEDYSITKALFTKQFCAFGSGIELTASKDKIDKLEVCAGNNKLGEKEACNLELLPGEITCVVGPTGSGKSRLLADIEWLANCDTPTNRKVLINGEEANDELVNKYGGKLIAQITQNMNFVLDMTVYDFLKLHTESRFTENAEQVVQEVMTMANDLSGESFTPETPITFLSGGQSRALMIADVACIGQAPIVLIDEIENAGVNKKKALDLLVSKDKIVLMATHDPLLILLADKRVVIKNGGMHRLIKTNKKETEFYKELKELDDKLLHYKDYFRNGHEL